MITYNELKEKCTCWKGYKRVPGTKPCAEDSCMKEEKDAGGHGSEKHHVLAFGRMNPITHGHEAVVNKVHEVAKANNASHSLVVSHSQDAKKNPLTGEQKVKHAKNAFPGTNVSSASKEAPTILHHAAAAHAAGAQHLHVVAGSDRHEEMHKLLHKYNGQDSAHGHYNFKSITVHSSGERDPDSEGTTGISASKMREHAASGNKQAFHAGAPSKMKPEHKDAMYNDVRKGMNLKEETQIDELKHSTVSNYMRRARTQLSNIEVSRRSSGDEKFGAEKARRRANTLNKIADKTDSRAVRDQLQKATAFVKEQAPVAPVPDRKYIKGTPEWKAHKEKSKPINGHPTNVKEETTDQQADRTKQLKRFKDQMTKLNGPTIDPEIALDKKEKEAMQVQEVLRPEMGAASYINDFIKSTNPRFNNKSKEERRKMAIGAFMAAKAKGVKEEVELEEGSFKYHMDKAIAADTKGDTKKKEYHLGNAKTARYAMPTADYAKHKELFDKYKTMSEEVQIDELSTELLGKYKTAAGASAKASDEAGNYKKGDKRFAGINKATRKQFDNDLKKHGQYVKEARGSADKHWTIAQDHREKASLATKGTEKYHSHMADHFDSMSRYHSELGQSSHADATAEKAEIHHEKAYEASLSKKLERDSVKESAMYNTPNSDRTDKKGIAYNPHRKEKTAADLAKINKAKEAEKNHTGLYKKQSPAQRKNTVKDLMKLVNHLGEGTMQPNGTDQIDTMTSAPTASTAKDTTMGKKIKGFKFFNGENDKQMNMNQPVKEEVLDEKSEQAKRNKTMKNMLDTLRGAKFKLNNPVPAAEPEHKTPQAHNKAIGRALRNEAMTGNPGNGYHGSVQSPDEKYEATHKHVKNLTDGDDKTVKHYMDSTHGRHLAGRENDHEYIKKDFKKFKKYYKPEMHEAVAPKAVNVDKVNHAGDKPHEEKWEPAKNVSKLKKEETMKSYKEFLQSLDEKLVGGQKKLDKNHNNKLDAQDFKMLRKEETEALDEIKMSELPSRKIQGKSYGADYSDPEGADDAWDKDKVKKPAGGKRGRPAGKGAGVYKARTTMSKLKAAGATYK